jgi:hypothetical protein
MDPDSQPVLEQQAREGNTEALAKEAQNPVANLISLPIQWNATPSSQWAPMVADPSAEANRTLNVWNVQPVVPFRLNNDFFLISRTILPVIQRPLAGSTDIIGIGDINPTVFLVPRTTSRFQFGFGPTLVIPSATDVQLSTQRWRASCGRNPGEQHLVLCRRGRTSGQLHADSAIHQHQPCQWLVPRQLPDPYIGLDCQQ